MIDRSILSTYPLAILSKAAPLETATAVGECTVRYAIYGAKGTPIDEIVEGVSDVIETEAVSTLWASCHDNNCYSAAIFAKRNPLDLATKREIARVMVASALALGHPFPLILDGSDYNLVLEAAKVCDTNEIPAELAPAYAGITPKDKTVAMSDQPAYRVNSDTLSKEEAELAVERCIKDSQIANKGTTALPSLLEFGSFTTSRSEGSITPPSRPPVRAELMMPTTPLPFTVDTYPQVNVTNSPVRLLPLYQQLSFLQRQPLALQLSFLQQPQASQPSFMPAPVTRVVYFVPHVQNNLLNANLSFVNQGTGSPVLTLGRRPSHWPANNANTYNVTVSSPNYATVSSPNNPSYHLSFTS